VGRPAALPVPPGPARLPTQESRPAARPPHEIALSHQETYALSAKTESEKFRLEIPPPHAHNLLDGTAAPAADLPPHLRARLNELGAETLVPVVTVFCRRYAVQDDQDCLTLDCCVYTDHHKHLGYGVLEYKSSNRKAAPPGRLTRLGLRPLKLSKFLWATDV
jgi:hypothetical protein